MQNKVVVCCGEVKRQPAAAYIHLFMLFIIANTWSALSSVKTMSPPLLLGSTSSTPGASISILCTVPQGMPWRR